MLSAAGAAELDAAELPHAAKESMSAVAVAIESAFFMCSKTSILKNNVPRYVLMEFSQVEDEQQAKDEDILEISKRLIAKNKQAYEVLAK